MASIEYRNSILWRGEDPLKQKWQLQRDTTKKVERYRPGKAPIWVQEEEKRKAEENERKKKKQENDDSKSRRKRRDRTAAAVILEDSGSSRLKRLREAASTTEPDPSERLVRHRTIHEARVIEAVDEKAKNEEDEKLAVLKKEEDFENEPRQPVAELTIPMYDDISGDEAEDNELRTLRRERAREAALMKRKEEEDNLKEEMGDEAASEEEDSSEEEESDDDDPRRAGMLKPVFVSKTQRETVKEKEALELEQTAAEERAQVRKKEHQGETKDILHETIRADDEAEAAGANDENDRSDCELIDDNDEVNEAEEYELWKIRELKRIKRDKEERLERHQELELIDRRRRMTDAEREADDKRMDGKNAKRDEVKQFNFLQKYYHRGTFFQDKATSGEEPLYNRDYHEPTAEETFDKNMLPKAMQLRRGQFGKKGQVKHTHLTDVDTTDQTAAWSQHTKVMEKYQTKMAAAKSINVFDRASISASSREPPP